MKPKIDLIEFGRELVRTGDLDPVYILLQNDDSLAFRKDMDPWLLAYWCFYHMGTASWIADCCVGPEEYWRRMETAAASKEYPRAHERRHFRGENARKSVAFLKQRGVPALFEPFPRYECPNVPLEDVMNYLRSWTGFGPWIAFKVADMLERLRIVDVKFDSASAFLFDSPREGAELANSIYGLGGPSEVMDYIIKEVDLPAPPRYERLINYQEAETVLCKWKSAMNGHYVIGEDIKACRAGLLRFAKCKRSQSLLKAGEGRLW